MGPNGSGKSTLAGVLAGRAGYEVTEGEVLYEGKDLLEMEPEERAREGVFLAFQYPVEIPGVTNAYFLQAAVNASASTAAQPELDAMRLPQARPREDEGRARSATSCSSAPVNEGFSGGEKKRNEIFQMAVLEPTLAILDETDSGLDIDALRIVADGVNAAAHAGAGDDRHHPLPAAARLHRARLRARPAGRPHREVRRQGTRARTREAGYEWLEAPAGSR